MDNRADRVYSFVRLMRLRENQHLYSKRTSPMSLLNYSPGDWVLISTRNTHRVQRKFKRVWCGPYQILTIISANVYQVRALTGDMQIVHASRMWYYELEGFVPTQELRDSFLHDFGRLEVDIFLDLRFFRQQFEIKFLG